ncbi:hypothetical protein CPB84DRAFT_1650118, partial [Gymnopilus junonius]
RSGWAPVYMQGSRFAKQDSSRCSHCPHEVETVNHYLFHCTKYRQQRKTMMDKLGTRTVAQLTLRQLTDSRKGIRILLQYISQTARFAGFKG